MSDDSEFFYISSEEEGERLDKVLSTRFKESGSRTYFQYLIDEKKVLVNGKIIKKRFKPISGDEVVVEYIPDPEIKVEPEDIPLDVLYEDNEIIVVNKPPGMVVHPAAGNWTGTFVNALMFHCRQKKLPLGDIRSEDTLRPGIVHRLDKDTSGLLIAAKTAVAQQSLMQMFADRLVYKEYLAVCIGNPGDGTVNEPIGRDPIHRQRMCIREIGGRHAITHYRTLSFNGVLSLVSVVIATGRTHQIRVHMRHIKTPILGDVVYGVASQNAKYKIQRQLLHAHCLSFNHPISGKPLVFKIDMPLDMQKIIKG